MRGVIDKPGSISISWGGTAFNIMSHLCERGAQVNFLSILRESSLSRLIQHAIENFGVRPYIDYRDDIPEAGFSGHLVNGELYDAVASCPVDVAALKEDRIREALVGCVAIIADCNLSTESLTRLGAAARERDIPLYVAGVSEAKCLKLAHLAGHPRMIAFMNRREAAALAGYMEFTAPPDSSILTASKLARNLECPVVVTMDKNGAILCTADQQISRHKSRTRLDPEKNHCLSGAGDLLLAETVWLHRSQGTPLGDAVELAQKVIPEALERQEGCSVRANVLDEAFSFITRMADQDPLTKLLNRRAGMVRMEHQAQLMDRFSKSMSVMFIDIDRFKTINDRFGHAVGDKVIQATARLLGQLFRRSSDLIIRWGGEEFVVVTCDIPMPDVCALAEQLRAQAEQCELEAVGRSITLSIGVADRALGESLDSLIERADEALYAAKEGGRNRVLCAPHKSPPSRANLSLDSLYEHAPG
ncbi:GGDEF domain-containing protein [Thioalkalivibrio thiocyanodenitrificans]|uniref:GGDEF domain-containing protein n=1 Tax=Thioalkalivibrio thiocyanodenitrificans TaxID=243063 RepID=UPI0003A7DA73|nr:PfkB family carbohydrate kinase [Thioalkalivibrio thiocyanodenitrificans]